MKIKLFLLFLIPFISLAQPDTTRQEVLEEVEDEPSKQVYDFVEKEPYFPGGEEAMMKWIRINVEYPSEALKNNEQGIVYVRFVVETDGSVTQVKVIRGTSAALDAEAVRVVKKMPNWEPGMQNGKAVRVYYTLPIYFTTGDPVDTDMEEQEPVDDKKKKRKRKKN